MIAFLSVQFSGIKYICNVEQTPHLIVVVVAVVLDSITRV